MAPGDVEERGESEIGLQQKEGQAATTGLKGEFVLFGVFF